MMTPEELNARCAGNLPGYLGLSVVDVGVGRISAELPVSDKLMAPNGFLHAGAVVTLADTACGNGCIANLPDGANGFTTVELKSNHVGTASDGTLECTASAVHMGRTTQVWDATVTHRESGKTLAFFRCTQIVLYPRNFG